MPFIIRSGPFNQIAARVIVKLKGCDTLVWETTLKVTFLKGFQSSSTFTSYLTLSQDPSCYCYHGNQELVNMVTNIYHGNQGFV